MEIVVGPKSVATGVQLAACSFVEQARKLPFGCDRLLLCTTPSGACAQNFSLDSGAHALFLRSRGVIDPGTYVGSITITAREDTKGYTSPAITLYKTASGPRFFGVVAILLGVVLAWTATSFARTRLARDQALLPAAFLSSQLTGLQKVIAGAPSPYHDKVIATESKIEELLNLLKEAYLDGRNFLPPRFPDPTGRTTVDGAGYTAHINKISDAVALLTLIVRTGFVQVWAQWQKGMPSGGEADIGDAVRDIDALSTESPSPTLDSARQRISVRLKDLDAKLHPKKESLRQTDSNTPPTTAPALSFERLSFQLTHIEVSVWLVWLLVTCVSGSAALVFSNLGFGAPLDYVLCFLWGFGLPAAGQQLLQISASSVSQALGVSVLKT